MRFSSVRAGDGRFRRVVLTVALAASSALADSSLGAAHAADSVAPVTSYPVEGGPSSIAVADLNADTFADLAVTNYSSVSILLGTASGSFAAATTYALEPEPGRARSVAVDDLNADTFPDLVVGVGGSGTAHTVQVLLGTGTGSFGTPVEYLAHTDPWSVVVGEFTGDGFLDIATANRVADSVSVLAGNGSGSFAAPVHHPVGEFPMSIDTGDLNGDSHLDLVTANANSDDLSVLLADGAGSFDAAISIPAAYYGSDVAIGHIDGDGLPDVAVADTIGDAVLVLLNDGSGGLRALPAIPTGNGATAVAIGDLNDDSFADLAVGNYDGGSVSVLSGDGTGRFGAKVHHSAVRPFAVAIAPLGSDPLPDLVHANDFTDDVTVRLNTMVPVVPEVPEVPATPGAPRLGFDSTGVSFGSREVAKSTSPRTVTITNTGSSAATLGATTVVGDMRGDFPLVSKCDGVLLPPGAACTVTIAFRPAAAGARTGRVEVSPVGGAPITLPVSGTGVRATITKVAVRGPAKAVKGRLATYKVRITNSGLVPATGVRLTVSGRGISLKARVGSIAAGTTKTVRVKLRPRAAAKVKATFRVTSLNAGGKGVKRTIKVR